MSLPPSEIPAGAMRFNSDSQKLEYWNGSQWVQVHTFSPNLATAGDPTPGARGVFHEGYIAPARSDTLSYVNLGSTGNAVDFGNLSQTRSSTTAVASISRGVIAGGFAGSASQDTIDFITIASTGNATDFGNLTVVRDTPGGHSNETRGIFGGGSPGPATVNTIDYITISATGNAVDFGDLTRSATAIKSSGNSVRAVWFGGSTSNIIDFVTISTLGNAQDFGDLDGNKNNADGCSSKTRIVIGGGYNPSPSLVQFNTIQYITIMTTGNATDFGDLTQKREATDSTSNCIRGIWAGGYDGPSPVVRFNIIDYVNIATQGDAVDFGDAQNTFASGSALSNAHGGL